MHPSIIPYYGNTGAINNRFCFKRGFSIGEQLHSTLVVWFQFNRPIVGSTPVIQKNTIKAARAFSVNKSIDGPRTCHIRNHLLRLTIKQRKHNHRKERVTTQGRLLFNASRVCFHIRSN